MVAISPIRTPRPPCSSSIQTVASRSANPPFDWNDQSGWDAVLDSVTAAYVSYAPDLAIPGATDSIRALVERAVETGVQRLVLLSGRGEEEAKLCESIVQDAGVEWTVVRASWFNQNFSEGEFLDMVLAGAITLPAGDVPEPSVDVDDIAWLLDYLFTTVLDGRNAFVCDGVQRALGREPTDFAEYARRIAVKGAWEVPSSHQKAVA